jgi:hypothetical protein
MQPLRLYPRGLTASVTDDLGFSISYQYLRTRAKLRCCIGWPTEPPACPQPLRHPPNHCSHPD